MILSPEMAAPLIALLSKMTPGEISTLAASLEEPDSRIGTSTSSAHYAFLKKLCEWGLAKEVPLELDLPPELRARVTSVAINPDAKATIGDLLKAASLNRGRTPEGG
jgi:hypothetical protein